MVILRISVLGCDKIGGKRLVMALVRGFTHFN